MFQNILKLKQASTLFLILTIAGFAQQASAAQQPPSSAEQHYNELPKNDSNDSSVWETYLKETVKNLDYDSENNKKTLLHIAAEKGNIELVKILLQEKNGNAANTVEGQKISLLDFINAPDNKKATALHQAVAENTNTEIINTLIARGANINAQTILGNTPLHVAVMRDKPEIVELLIGLGSNPIIKNVKKFTALQIAEDKRCYSVITKLKKSLDAEQYYNTLTKMDQSYWRTYLKDIVTNLCFDPVADRQTTLLHVATKNENLNLIKVLLEAEKEDGIKKEENVLVNIQKGVSDTPPTLGLLINAKNSKGNTALHLAALKNNQEIINLLKEEGADQKITNDAYQTAEQFATSSQPKEEEGAGEEKEKHVFSKTAQLQKKAMITSFLRLLGQKKSMKFKHY
jgi:ankyrin repeat protein